MLLLYSILSSIHIWYANSLSTSAQGIVFVEGNVGESPIETCMRSNLVPTEIFLSSCARKHNRINIWQDSSNHSRIFNLSGCCEPGLWCQGKYCETNSLGSHFHNFGWLFNQGISPVYSCKFENEKSVISTSITLVSQSKQVLQVTGDRNAFLPAESINSINILGEYCGRVQQCSAVCQRCDYDDCPLGSICLTHGAGEISSCFSFCAGPMDRSCPCGTICERVDFADTSTLPWSFYSIHICTPKSLAAGKNPCASYDIILQCEASPQLYTALYQLKLEASTLENTAAVHLYYHENLNVSITTSNRYIRTQRNELSFSTHVNCSRSADCHDGNICTVGSCDNVTHQCVYKKIPQCHSMSTLVTDQQTDFVYLTKYFSKGHQRQTLFSEFLRSHGTQSSISHIDDFPYTTIPDIGFEFPYFGNLIHSAALQPNGFVLLPPYHQCSGEYNSVKCIVYSTSANILSLWANDWDPSNSLATVYYFHQRQGQVPLSHNGTSPLYNVDADALHVLFYRVTPYQGVGAVVNESEFNTFAVSIYRDGSIRIGYHTVRSPVRSVSGYGLFGSRASQSPRAATRYNHVGVPANLIADGVDAVFCYVSALACPVRACVYPGTTLEVLWKSRTCLAMGLENLNITCEWAGGTTSTSPRITTLDGRPSLSCPVPELNVPDDSLITVYIRASFPLTEGAGESELPDSNDYFHMIHGAMRHDGEIAMTYVMVKYFRSSDTHQSCGCDALEYADVGGRLQTCDSCLVCGGDGSTVDCNGDCFGVAYEDTCGHCAGGLSRTVPRETCDYIPSNNAFSFGLFSEAIVLVLVTCCLTLAFSVFVWAFRVVISETLQIRHAAALGTGIRVAHPYLPPGLTEEQRVGLGEFVMELSEHQTQRLIIANEPSGECAMEGRLSQNEESSEQEVGPGPGVSKRSESAFECPICLVTFSNGDRCRRLPPPCEHVFHKECIDTWFQSSVLCPMCKRSVRELRQQVSRVDPDPVPGGAYRQAALPAIFVPQELPSSVVPVPATSTADTGADRSWMSASFGRLEISGPEVSSAAEDIGSLAHDVRGERERVPVSFTSEPVVLHTRAWGLQFPVLSTLRLRGSTPANQGEGGRDGITTAAAAIGEDSGSGREDEHEGANDSLLHAHERHGSS